MSAAITTVAICRPCFPSRPTSAAAAARRALAARTARLCPRCGPPDASHSRDPTSSGCFGIRKRYSIAGVLSAARLGQRPRGWLDRQLDTQDIGLGALRSAAGHSAGGGFGSPFMGGAPAHAASVFRGGFSAFPALTSAAPRPLGVSSRHTLSAPADPLPQVCSASRVTCSLAVPKHPITPQPRRPAQQHKPCLAQTCTRLFLHLPQLSAVLIKCLTCFTSCNAAGHGAGRVAAVGLPVPAGLRVPVAARAPARRGPRR